MALAQLIGYRGISSLLLLPKYSDLQIVCQEIDFAVHKAIVCSQSPVLAANIDGNFVVRTIPPKTIKKSQLIL
jgi:hypothetical protein